LDKNQAKINDETPHSPHDLFKNKQTKTNKQKSMKENKNVNYELFNTFRPELVRPSQSWLATTPLKPIQAHKNLAKIFKWISRDV